MRHSDSDRHAIGIGARDATIWLTVRDDHLSRTEDGYFVTNNNRDFAEPGSRAELHHDLAAELRGHESPLGLCTSPASVVEALGTEEVAFIDEAAITSSEPLKVEIRRLALDRDLMVLLRPPEELTRSGDARVFAASDVTVGGLEVKELRGFSVAESRVAISRVEWRMAFELGILEKAGVGYLQRTVPVEVTAIGFVWFGGGADDGGEARVEVARVAYARAAAI